VIATYEARLSTSFRSAYSSAARAYPVASSGRAHDINA
jgi:hypothetical protein